MARKIYSMGIKGVGMATLAVMAKQAGFIVGGSDVEEEFITDKILREAEIDVRIGFKKENVEGFFGTNSKDECFMIATAAHDGFENPETIYAKEKGCKVVSHGEAVGLFMSGNLFDRTDIEGISVAGAHGKTIDIRHERRGRTVSAVAAKTVTSMMVNAVEFGEAKWTKIPNYEIAGKTGTAQIPVAGHYDPNQTIASFVGFFPAKDPKVTMLVLIDRPKASIYGAETAAPIFFSIARDLIQYYNIPPSF